MKNKYLFKNRKSNLLYKDIKEFNIIFLLLIGLILIGVSGYSSYAIFSDEIISNNEIKATVKMGNLDTSGANVPLLTSNMIPVYYDNTSSSWKKADSENKNKNYKWYDYDSKMWANAVTVTDTNRTTYLNASAGTEIPMSDINTMWVWIPRYKYTYFASSTPVEIPITFEKGTESTGTIKCVDAISANSGKSETCTDTTNGTLTVGKSTYTHPAFTFGSDELPGLWVAKFELGGSLSSSVAYVESDDDLRMISNYNDDKVYDDLLDKDTDDGNIKQLAPDQGGSSNTCKNEECNISRVVVLPNSVSVTNEGVSGLFFASRSMQKTNNPYGFDSSVNIHMIKNMEWGVVAYLSHSKYGMCAGGTCSEIGVNNYYSNNYMTGCGAAADSAVTTTCNQYDTNAGMLASTTGNIYGVYDMSGGVEEYVMANMQNTANGFYSSAAGFVEGGTTPSIKYFDRYSYGTDNTVNISKLGEGIIEVSTLNSGLWYNDLDGIVNHYSSWILRGGRSDFDTTGLFNSYPFTGGNYSYFGTRVSLVVFPN